MTNPKQGKRTIEQERAEHAWRIVQSIKSRYAKNRDGEGKPDAAAKKFGGQAKKLPTRIMACGLGQALAFLRAKKYAPELLQALGDWVLDKRRNPRSSKSPPSDDALLQHIIRGSSADLRRATDETLAYLQWLNRFAEAEDLTEDD